MKTRDYYVRKMWEVTKQYGVYFSFICKYANKDLFFYLHKYLLNRNSTHFSETIFSHV